MPRRALSQKRPFLLASIIAALAFFYLRVGPLPELYLIPLKGSAMALLAVYCVLRHSSPDARLLGWAFGAAALGDMAIEVDRTIGGTLFFLYHVLALGVYLRHRHARLAKADSWIVGLTLILVPLAGYLLPYDRTQAMQTTLYALALGAMAAGAWASTFPRWRVGAGAMLFVLSDLLLFAEMGPLGGTQWPGILVWPIYYLAQLLICTGVIQTLGKREPELKLVSSQ
jgi:lipoprotein signal peptidase